MESNEPVGFTCEIPANITVDLRRHTMIHLKTDCSQSPQSVATCIQLAIKTPAPWEGEDFALSCIHDLKLRLNYSPRFTKKTGSPQKI